MTDSNQKPLKIWETRQFKPWGIGEKTEFWICRETTENGQTCLNSHVAGPFYSESAAVEVLLRLRQGAI